MRCRGKPAPGSSYEHLPDPRERAATARVNRNFRSRSRCAARRSGTMTAALLERQPLGVINVGLPAFTRSVREAGGHVSEVQWQPPGDADPALAWALAELTSDA